MANPDSGKQKTFSEAYHPLHDRLVRFVQSQVWSREDIKDIVNETVLQTYERFETLRNQQALLSFMFTIASRQIYKYLNSKKILFEKNGAFSENIKDSSATPDIKLEAKELVQALCKLPDAQREALVLFEISGLSINEIQEIQGDSISAIKSRLARGREALRKMFEEETAISIHPENSNEKSGNF